MRLIDADKFEFVCLEDKTDDFMEGARAVLEMIDNAPTIEAVQVRHGRWKFGKNHGDFVEAECSNCNGILLVKWYDKLSEYHYCPNCGAKMDLEETNNAT